MGDGGKHILFYNGAVLRFIIPDFNERFGTEMQPKLRKCHTAFVQCNREIAYGYRTNGYGANHCPDKS